MVKKGGLIALAALAGFTASQLLGPLNFLKAKVDEKITTVSSLERFEAPIVRQLKGKSTLAVTSTDGFKVTTPAEKNEKLKQLSKLKEGIAELEKQLNESDSLLKNLKLDPNKKQFLINSLEETCNKLGVVFYGLNNSFFKVFGDQVTASAKGAEPRFDSAEQKALFDAFSRLTEIHGKIRNALIEQLVELQKK